MSILLVGAPTRLENGTIDHRFIGPLSEQITRALNFDEILRAAGGYAERPLIQAKVHVEGLAILKDIKRSEVPRPLWDADVHNTWPRLKVWIEFFIEVKPDLNADITSCLYQNYNTYDHNVEAEDDIFEQFYEKLSLGECFDRHLTTPEVVDAIPNVLTGMFQLTETVLDFDVTTVKNRVMFFFNDNREVTLRNTL